MVRPTMGAVATADLSEAVSTLNILPEPWGQYRKTMRHAVM